MSPLLTPHLAAATALSVMAFLEQAVVSQELSFAVLAALADSLCPVLLATSCERLVARRVAYSGCNIAYESDAHE